MTTGDTSDTKSWRRGCGFVIASFLFFAVVTAFVALRPVREAKRVEQSLTDRFGEVPTWSPAADGTVPPDRIEAFMTVRGRLQEACARFEDDRQRMEQIGQLEEEGKLSSDDVLDGFKTVLRFGPSFLHLMRFRNEALLDEGMGLGEYSYIYVLAYGDLLSSLSEEEGHGNFFKPRTRRELTQILRNQLEVLELHDANGGFEDLRLSIQEEIIALETGAHAFPWQDAMPPLIEASMHPYEGRLDELFCEAAVNFELRQKNTNALGFRD